MEGGGSLGVAIFKTSILLELMPYVSHSYKWEYYLGQLGKRTKEVYEDNLLMFKTQSERMYKDFVFVFSSNRFNTKISNFLKNPIFGKTIKLRLELDLKSKTSIYNQFAEFLTGIFENNLKVNLSYFNQNLINKFLENDVKVKKSELLSQDTDIDLAENISKLIFSDFHSVFSYLTISPNIKQDGKTNTDVKESSSYKYSDILLSKDGTELLGNYPINYVKAKTIFFQNGSEVHLNAFGSDLESQGFGTLDCYTYIPYLKHIILKGEDLGRVNEYFIDQYHQFANYVYGTIILNCSFALVYFYSHNLTF